MTLYDWRDELEEANDEEWTVNRTKFDKSYIVREYDIRKSLFP